MSGTGEAEAFARRRLQLGIVVVVALTAIVATPNVFRTYGIVLGHPSPRTIKAPHSVSFIDIDRTRVLRRLASRRVENVYEVDPNSIVRVERNVMGFFDKAGVVSAKPLPLESKVALLDKNVHEDIPRQDLKTAAGLSSVRLELVRTRAVEFATTILADKITVDNIDTKRQSLQLAARSMDLPPALDRLVGSVVSVYLQPTYTLNGAITEQARLQAAAGVAPVIVRKQQGETIVEEGRVVTGSDITALKEEGLLGGTLGGKQVLGYSMAVLALVFTVSLYLHHYRRDIYDDMTRMAILSIIVVVFALIVKVMAPFSSPYLIPFVAPAVLAGILLGARTAVITTLVVTVLAFLMVPESALPVIVLMIGSLAAALMLAKIVERRHVFFGAIFGVAMVGFLSVTTSFIAGQTLRESMLNGWYGLIGGVFGVGLVLVGLPFFESVFHVTTDIRLLELADPSQPLMRDLMLKAPGTYNHSMVVGNLVEGAAPSIGANPLKARVGAYYHDIGKVRRPLFFVENQQLGQNPHDRTKPHLSYMIVTAHVKDGADLARENHVPEEIVDIIRQHHGTSVVTYFYEEERKRETKQAVSQDDFRYESVKPRTREAALVMLADVVEAAARTMKRPTPDRLEHLAKKLIKARLDDGQLDESGLTLGDLEDISKHFAQSLASIYHARIDYPEAQVASITKARKARGNQHKQ